MTPVFLEWDVISDHGGTRCAFFKFLQWTPHDMTCKPCKDIGMRMVAIYPEFALVVFLLIIGSEAIDKNSSHAILK